MISRNDILCEAVDNCIKEMYANCQPHVEWEDFIKQNKEWKEGEPRPYEFYYLPKEIFKDIADSYIYAYSIGSTLSNHLDLIVKYFEEPIRDKYIHEEGKPGYRSYERFEPLKNIIGEDAYKSVLDYIEEARRFYSSDYELSSFNMSVYLGPGPNSNKEAVIENWKKYRNQDITIDESVWNEEDY